MQGNTMPSELGTSTERPWLPLHGGRCALLCVLALAGGCDRAEPPAAVSVPPSSETYRQFSERVDPWVARPRVIVMTDIANEPDDQMSMVRLLVYANQFDIEGLVATTSTWMRARVRPDVIREVLDAYAQVHPTLSRHAGGFPPVETLRALVTTGPEGYGMAAVRMQGDEISVGARQIVMAADRVDERPLWVLAWGGANTLAEALAYVRRTRPAQELDALVSKLRVYAISDQDDAGPWLRREFPTLHFVGRPSTPDGEEYYLATWTGISGDRFYKNADGADFSTFTSDWVHANIRSKGPLGRLYIPPCCIHEGDTPSFLGLIDNGLASFVSPTYGGWGGRYVWRQAYGETRPSWTQGGDSYPGRDNSKDTVIGVDGRPRTSDQATIWRWRDAFQRDFAARMDWTIKAPGEANHNPVAVVNGQDGRAPLTIDTTLGTPVVLDASASTDPDGHALRYSWFFYPEAGTGIPTQPVALGAPAQSVDTNQNEGGIPSAPDDGPPEPAARVVLDRPEGPRITATMRTAGTAHVILVVDDDGTPSLTSYRRIILRSPTAVEWQKPH
jgi:hypothetical protein